MQYMTYIREVLSMHTYVYNWIYVHICVIKDSLLSANGNACLTPNSKDVEE